LEATTAGSVLKRGNPAISPLPPFFVAKK